jgi:Putative Ig domain
VRRALTLVVVAVVALGASAAPASSVTAKPTRVTVIGDSIAASLALESDARRILARGIDLDLQATPCRRLVGESCPYEGVRPPSLVTLLPSLELGSTVVVAVGYNDFESTFATTIETALAALAHAHVESVFWLTLRAERQSYLHMNDLLREAADRHPELTLVDWNLYSRSHPEWFQPDGLHLQYAGAVAMATLIQKALAARGLVAASKPQPLAIATKRLPAGHIGHRYAARLVTSGGTAPVRWARAKGVLPAGLSLQRNGVIKGKPRTAGKRSVLFRATDARGRSVARRLAIAVSR